MTERHGHRAIPDAQRNGALQRRRGAHLAGRAHRFDQGAPPQLDRRVGVRRDGMRTAVRDRGRSWDRGRGPLPGRLALRPHGGAERGAILGEGPRSRHRRSRRPGLPGDGSAQPRGELLHSLHQIRQSTRRRQVHRPQQRYLQGVAGARRLRHFVLRLLQELEDARQLRRIVLPRLARKGAQLVIGEILLHPRQRGQDQVARVRGQLLRQALEVCARFVRADHALQRRRRVASQHGPDGACHHALIEGAQRLHRFRFADLLRTGVRGKELIEQAERVAHRPGGLAGHQGQGRVGHLDALRLRDLTQPGDDLPQGYQLEVVPLDTGKDGRGQLLRIRRGQEELDVARRLLQRLEQRVERGAAQHVDLVDDVDFVTIARG